MKVAVCFDCVGPYHLARLRACAVEHELLVLQTVRRRQTVPWRAFSGDGSVKTLTLLPGDGAATVAWTELKERVEGILRNFGPSVVFVPGWSRRAALATLYCCQDVGVPVAVMSESTGGDCIRRTWMEWLKRRVTGLYSAALVGGRPQAEYIQRLGLSRERIFLGYDAVDNDYFALGARSARGRGATARQEHGLPERYFMASARFVEKKNLVGLVRAYEEYRALFACSADGRPRSQPPWDLVLLGDGPLRGALEAEVQSLGLQVHVHLPGLTPYAELPTYYGLASGFVHASTIEQWGLVVNEAMASGLPVLVSNRCGCAPDLLREGVNGFSFDPDNSTGLAELMCRLTEAPRSRVAEMGEAGRRIVSRWGPARFAEGFAGAARMAVEVGPKRANGWDRLFLRALMERIGDG